MTTSPTPPLIVVKMHQQIGHPALSSSLDTSNSYRRQNPCIPYETHCITRTHTNPTQGELHRVNTRHLHSHHCFVIIHLFVIHSFLIIQGHAHKHPDKHLFIRSKSSLASVFRKSCLVSLHSINDILQKFYIL